MFNVCRWSTVRCSGLKPVWYSLNKLVPSITVGPRQANLVRIAYATRKKSVVCEFSLVRRARSYRKAGAYILRCRLYACVKPCNRKNVLNFDSHKNDTCMMRLEMKRCKYFFIRFHHLKHSGRYLAPSRTVVWSFQYVTKMPEKMPEIYF